MKRCDSNDTTCRSDRFLLAQPCKQPVLWTSTQSIPVQWISASHVHHTHTPCYDLQISVSYTELDGCSKLLASLLNHVEALRADLLVVTGDVAASLKEHELCKVGLYEYNAKAQEAYSSSLKELMLQVYDISQALLLQGITKPTFDTVEVRLLLTHDVPPPESIIIRVLCCSIIHVNWNICT